MSAPISHLVYARKYLDNHKVADEAAFIAGTIFPDIRYMGTVTRSKTHAAGKYTVASIQAENDSWKAGTYYHNLVDDLWINYVTKHAPEIAADPLKIQALKMLEDEFLYSEIEDWLPVRVALRVVPTAEHNLVAPETSLKWHSLINKLVVAPPQRERRASFLHELGYEDEKLAELEEQIKQLRINSETLALLKGVSEHIISATKGKQF
jgi:hypothetical protein